jgi:hypothetical protein
VRRNWQGVSSDHSGRPGKFDVNNSNYIGTANIVNKKRYNHISEN